MLFSFIVLMVSRSIASPGNLPVTYTGAVIGHGPTTITRQDSHVIHHAQVVQPVVHVPIIEHRPVAISHAYSQYWYRDLFRS